MTKLKLPALQLSILLSLCMQAEAKSYRDPEVRRAFMKLHPCPSTGKTKGACPGWQVDHIIPLCFYGVDATWNMGWKTVRDHREKTKLDVKVCTWDGK